jgi:glycosyltransferase involved in cell wall biosynthesis
MTIATGYHAHLCGNKTERADRIVIGQSAERIRVLIVNSTLHIGGAERVSACLAQYLDRRRFELTACFLKEMGLVGEEMLRNGVELIPLPGSKGKGKRDRFTSLKLLDLLKTRRIQVLHTHDMHGFMDACICKLLLPSLRHVHTFHFGNYPHRDLRYKLIERILWRVPDRLVAVGHEQARTIRTLYNIPEQRMTVLWNGVDAPKPDIAPEIRALLVNEKRPVIGSISTLTTQKGLHHLLNAAAILKQSGLEFVLLIAGRGNLRDSLMAQTDALKLNDHVRFLGWVNEASHRMLPACDIFVQSSLWEAMSVVVLEAMAAGKPVVITKVGENSHMVEEGGCGLLVPPGDAEALANSIGRLLSDLELRQQLGTAARQRYIDCFTVQDMITRHQDLYTELVCNRYA